MSDAREWFGTPDPTIEELAADEGMTVAEYLLASAMVGPLDGNS